MGDTFTRYQLATRTWSNLLPKHLRRTTKLTFKIPAEAWAAHSVKFQRARSAWMWLHRKIIRRQLLLKMSNRTIMGTLDRYQVPWELPLLRAEAVRFYFFLNYYIESNGKERKRSVGNQSHNNASGALTAVGDHHNLFGGNITSTHHSNHQVGTSTSATRAGEAGAGGSPGKSFIILSPPVRYPNTTTHHHH